MLLPFRLLDETLKVASRTRLLGRAGTYYPPPKSPARLLFVLV